MRLDRPQAAIPHLKAALAHDDEGQIHYRLAQAYRATGREQQAEAVLREFRRVFRSARARREVDLKELEITAPQ